MKIAKFGAVLTILVSLSFPAWAERGSSADTSGSELFVGSALNGGELRSITGQADVVLEVRAQNSSNVSNNSVDGNSVTGTIGFDSQSFQNLSGLAVVSANTGNNASINSSLNVNVAVNP